MPSKGTRRKGPPSSNFLFVNEDATTVTRVSKDRDLGREKQSHVQRQYFARRRLDKKDEHLEVYLDSSQAENDACVDQGTESPTAALRHRFPNLDFHLPGPSHSDIANFGSLQLDAEANTTSDRPDFEAGTDDSLQVHHYRRRPGTFPSTLSSLSNIDDRYTRDAFEIALNSPLRSSFPHPLLATSSYGPLSVLSQWAPPLMQYWTTVLMREKFYHDTRGLPLSRLRHAPAIHAEMQDAMSAPSHLYSLLAAVSIQMLVREGRLFLPSLRVSEVDHVRIPLYFKTRAIESLRASLASGPITHNTVLVVHRLMIVAYFTDAYEAAIPHFDAMLR